MNRKNIYYENYKIISFYSLFVRLFVCHLFLIGKALTADSVRCLRKPQKYLIFLKLEKSFFLVARSLPPPPLCRHATKKELFAASLIHVL